MQYQSETEDTRPPAIFLMGPTASGKTGLAIDLVQRYPLEIVSVDSAMVYRGMDIGTAKPTLAERALAPHRLIDICDPADTYSVSAFQQDSQNAMREITRRGKIPLLVGGTLLYFKMLLTGIDQLPGANARIRNEILAQAQSEGWPALHKLLQSSDPETAERLHPNDAQRIQRALEVYRLTNKPYSSLLNQTRLSQEYLAAFDYRVLQLSVAPSQRTKIHADIETRFHRMLQSGFIDEVKCLYNRGDLSAVMPSMRCVGYRQIWSYLEGNFTYAQAVEKGICATRQLAKRQLTWLRSWPNLTHLRSDDKLFNKQAIDVVDVFLHGGC